MSKRFAQVRVFAGAGVLVVAVAVVVGAFVFGILPLPEHAALGPDRIAFVSDRDGDDEIYVMNADGGGVVQLTDNDFSDIHPTWSSDGGRIAFASDRGNDVQKYDIYVMNADGRGVEQLTDDCSNGHLAWSPGGNRIAFVSRGDIYVMNADGSGVEQLTGNPPESCSYLFLSDRDGEAAYYIRNADGSVEPYELNWESWYRKSNYTGPKWSPDGNRIALSLRRDGEFGVYVMNADGSGLEEIAGNDEALIGGVGWSPDGDRLAFGAVLGYDDHAEIYVVNADGSGLWPLTGNEHEDYLPAWSPDGGRIAFVSDRDGDLGVYVMYADGSGVERLGDGYNPAWSPLLD